MNHYKAIQNIKCLTDFSWWTDWPAIFEAWPWFQTGIWILYRKKQLTGWIPSPDPDADSIPCLVLGSVQVAVDTHVSHIWTDNSAHREAWCSSLRDEMLGVLVSMLFYLLRDPSLWMVLGIDSDLFWLQNLLNSLGQIITVNITLKLKCGVATSGVLVKCFGADIVSEISLRR